MDYITAIKLRAMHAVVEGNEDAFLRAVHRWYSREFSTPLHVVETIPIETILQNYYEDIYSEMDEPQREQEIQILTLTDQERIEKEAQEDAFLKAAQEDVRKEKARLENKKNNKSKDLEPSIDTPKAPPPDISINFQDPNLSGESPDLEGKSMIGAPPPRKKR